ncbi:Retrovirus-related Pol polyprotein from transposon RE2 [Vitis vinifera]|uniref:Retrovirus-related Pol polyprotein from transposon RE2 n=1 Tax=Vitis vinifera TaxID=29760 RepID=A0A438HD07_VITVI|nr:Retrovirus-related Pol polyprotein from transposon RE2 [Vitis vinifera]
MVHQALVRDLTVALLCSLPRFSIESTPTLSAGSGNHTDFSARFLRALPHRFFLKDLGDLHYFLGIKVLPTLTSLLLTQHKYIWDLLAKTNMACAKECVMPMSSTSILQLNDGSPSTNAITFL